MALPGCLGKTKSGSPCKGPLVKGYDYCRRHLGQRPLSPAEASQLVAVQTTLAKLEQELSSQFPRGMVVRFLKKLEAAALNSPDMAAWLAEPSNIPTIEDGAFSKWDAFTSWMTQLQDRLAPYLTKLQVNLTADREAEVRSKNLKRAAEYLIHTSQEWTAILQAASDGKYGAHYSSDVHLGTRRHQRPNTTFLTELRLLDDERDAGYSVDLLADFTDKMDADAALALLYIAHCLAPPGQPRPQHNGYAGGQIDLADVARKIGLTARSEAEGDQNRAFIWDVIRFGARARILGARSSTYYDRDSRKEIPTEIDTTPWAITERERPIQPALMECDTVPVRVELVMSSRWTALTTAPETAQYLPFGEIIGSIPGNQPGGSYARVIGLAYLGFCRRNPQLVLTGQLQPTRAELLGTFRSKKAAFDEILESANPARLIQYWCKALAILSRDKGILAPSGEAATTFEQWKRRQQQDGSRKNWQAAWLSETVDLRPGPALQTALRERADALPPPRPRRFATPRLSKR